MLNFFKVFFPTWSFFNTFNNTPILQFKIFPEDPWADLTPPPRRHELSLFFNARVNYQHACNNHLLQWLQEMQKMDEEQLKNIESSQAFQIAQNMVSFGLRQNHVFESFQFRLLLRSPLNNKEEVILTSKVISC